MATTNPIVSGITGYVDQNNEELLTKSVLGAKSIGLFNIQTGVKGATALQLMENEIVLQDGHSCGWSESGSTTFSQRNIVPAVLKVNMAFCDKNLIGTWAQHKVRVAAGMETLPFEEKWTGDIVKNVDAKVEKMLYQGQSGKTDEFEGFISILDGANPITVSSTSGTSAYSFLKDVAAKIPAEIEAPVILVSIPLYREYMQDLVSANLYHYSPADGANEYALPGTDIKVIAVAGLNGTSTYDYAIAGDLKNFYVGCDMLGDEDIFDLFYSKDNKEFRLDIEFAMGAQIAYPAEVVFGKRAQ